MAILLRDATEEIDSVTVDTPTSGITKGEFVQVGPGSVYGFAYNTATVDTTDTANYAPEVTCVTKCRQALYSKATGSGAPEFAIGATIYYNSTTGLAQTTNASSAIKVGYAKELATDDSSTVLGSFDGTLNI